MSTAKRWMVDGDDDTWWEVGPDQWLIDETWEEAAERAPLVRLEYRTGRLGIIGKFGVKREGVIDAAPSPGLIGPTAGTTKSYRLAGVEYSDPDQAERDADALARHGMSSVAVVEVTDAGARTPFYAKHTSIYDADGVLVATISTTRSEREQLAYELTAVVNEYYSATVAKPEPFPATVDSVDEIPAGAVAFRTSKGDYAARGTAKGGRPAGWWWVYHSSDEGRYEHAAFDLTAPGHEADQFGGGPLQVYYSAGQAPDFMRKYIEKTRVSDWGSV